MAGLMGGLARQNENHLGKIEALARLAGKDKVPVMNRIECAAVDTDLFQRNQSSRYCP